MNFKSFINHASGCTGLPLLNESIKIDTIISDCKKFIKESKGHFLYRGIKNMGFYDTKIERFEVNTNRKPLDTPSLLQTLFDEEFSKLYGVKPRASSIFCTGSRSLAGDYGRPMVIFPIGNYTYWWSPDVLDLVDIWSTYNIKLADVRINTPEYTEDPSELISKINKLLTNRKYYNTDLVNAISSSNEIMILCKEYYAVDIETAKEVIDGF